MTGRCFFKLWSVIAKARNDPCSSCTTRSQGMHPFFSVANHFSFGRSQILIPRGLGIPVNSTSLWIDSSEDINPRLKQSSKKKSGCFWSLPVVSALSAAWCLHIGSDIPCLPCLLIILHREQPTKPNEFAQSCWARCHGAPKDVHRPFLRPAFVPPYPAPSGPNCLFLPYSEGMYLIRPATIRSV